MSEGTRTKKQLGRIAVERHPQVSAELDEIDPRIPLARTTWTLEEPAFPSELPDERTMVTVDLRRVSVPASALALVSHELALELMILPLSCDGERLTVAVDTARERRRIEELERTTGKRVTPQLATHGELRIVIDAAYTAIGAGAALYRGPHTTESDAHAGSGKARSRPPRASQAQSDATALKRGRRVLVVDDSADLRRLLARALREQGYDVVESATGQEALQRVREAAPDILVLDAMLPEVHGFDVCRRIKGSRRYGHIPIVMMSEVYRGWRFAEDLRRSYGVDAFLEKPFRMAEMLDALEGLFSNREGGARPEHDEADGPAGEQLQLGLDAYGRGELATAIDHFRRGCELAPRAFRLHYHLGLLYGKQDNVFEAIQALETAADLKPRDFSTLKNLAVLYQRAGFRLKASELWERALGSAPDDTTRDSIRNHLVSLL